MLPFIRPVFVLGFVLAAAGCAANGSSNPPAESAVISSVATATPDPCPTPDGAVPNVFSVPGEFAPLDTTTYWVDPDVDACTSLRVLFTIPAEGWQAWTGTFKESAAADGAEQRVGVSIVTVTNLVVDGCTDHSLADPPVGPTVDDLISALAELPPFLVTSPASDVTVDGYSGKRLQLSLPEIDLSECVDGEVISWDAPVLSYPFHGYLPRLIEEFWVLDVDGSRLVIIPAWSPDAPPEDIGELHAVLDSIQIEP